MKLLLNKKIYCFEKYINNRILYLFNKYKINSYLISFSGGLDSKFLLKLFLNIKSKINSNIFIEVIHINHNININSKIWENKCINYCKNNKLKIYIDNIYIKNFSNLENNLRILRYKKISKYIKNNQFLVTGHHKNDKIESFFLNLLNRKSLYGLVGIREIRKIFNMKIFSPLIKYSKKDILKFSNFIGINDYIIDNSNFNIYYDRNFIRNKIINLLENRWTNIIDKIDNTLGLINDNLYFIDYIIKENFKNLLYKNKYIMIILLYYKIFFYIKLIFIKWLKYLNIKYNFNIINNMYNIFFLNNNNNNKILLKNKIIYKYNNIIYYTNNFNINKLKKIIIKINYNNFIKILNTKYNKIKLPYNIGYLRISKKDIKYNLNFIILNKLKLYDNLIIKFNICKNYKFNFKNKKTNIKNIYKYFNIPIYIRKKIPFIFINNKLFSILGYIYKKKINFNNIFYLYFKLNINK